MSLLFEWEANLSEQFSHNPSAKVRFTQNYDVCWWKENIGTTELISQLAHSLRTKEA